VKKATIYILNYISCTVVTIYKQWQIAIIAVHSWNKVSLCSDFDFRLTTTLLMTDASINTVIECLLFGQ